MEGLDSPHWSWFHGCSKHKGKPAPCQACISERDPDITQDGSWVFRGKSVPAAQENPWDEFYAQMSIDTSKNTVGQFT